MWKRLNIKFLLRNLKNRFVAGERVAAGSGFCFYCGVDSKPLIVFFLATLGMAVLGALLIFLWSVASGHWHESESPKYKILEAESNEPNTKQ